MWDKLTWLSIDVWVLRVFNLNYNVRYILYLRLEAFCESNSYVQQLQVGLIEEYIWQQVERRW